MVGWGKGYWIVWKLSNEFPLLSEICSDHKENEYLWLYLKEFKEGKKKSSEENFTHNLNPTDALLPVT